MEPESKLVKCPFPTCQQTVEFPPTFDDILQCSCGAKYHYEFGSDLGEEIINVEEDAKEWKYAVEWKYVFVGVAKWYNDKEFDIIYVEEKKIKPHQTVNKIYLFFVLSVY